MEDRLPPLPLTQRGGPPLPPPHETLEPKFEDDDLGISIQHINPAQAEALLKIKYGDPGGIGKGGTP